MNGLVFLSLGTSRTVPRIAAHRRQPTYTAAGVDTIRAHQLAADCDEFMGAFDCADEDDASYI